MSAEAYGLVGLASGVAMCVLLVAAFLKAALDAKWTRAEWEQERVIVEGEIARAHARALCLPDPLEVLWAVEAREPQRTLR